MRKQKYHSAVWSSLVARQTHNPEAVGSHLPPETNKINA